MLKQFFERKLKIYEHEFYKFLWVALIFFGIFYATAIFRNYVDTAFLKRYGPEHIPLMLAINGVLSIGIFGFFNRIIHTLKDHGLLVLFLACYGGLVVALFVMIQAQIDLAYPVLYQMLYLMESVFLVYLWNIAGDLFDARQGKRLFPLITACQVLATAFGNFSTGPMTALIGRDQTLLIFAGFCFVLSFSLMYSAKRLIKQPKARSSPKGKRQSMEFKEISRLITEYPIVRYLIIVGLIPNILLPIFTYQFSVIANNTFLTEETLIHFLSIFRGGTTLGIFFLLFFAGRIYARVGLVNASLFHPINYTIIFSGLIAFFNIYTAAYGQFTIRLIQRSISGPVNKVLFTIVPDEIAVWVRGFVRGTVIKLGTMLGALTMVFLIKFGFSAQFLAVLGVLLTLYWVVETLLFSRRYKKGLKQVILEDRIDFDQINSTIGLTAQDGLLEGQDSETGYRRDDPGFDIEIENIPTMSAQTALPLLRDDNPMVRAEAAASFSNCTDFRAIPQLVNLLSDEEVVRKAAVNSLARYKQQVLPYLEVIITDKPYRVQRSILEVLRLSGVRDLDIMPFIGQKLIRAYNNLIAQQYLEQHAPQDAESLHMLKAYLQEDHQNLLSLIFYALWFNYEDMRLMYEALRSSQASVAVELIETSIDSNLNRYLIPLIDALPLPEKIRLGRKVLPLIHEEGLERMLNRLVKSDDPTGRTIAAYCIGHYDPNPSYLPILDHALNEVDPLLKEVIEFATNKCCNLETSMPELIQRIHYLKQLALFEGMGLGELQAIASIARHRTLEPNKILIEEGDDNSAVYLIVDGQIDVFAHFGTPEQARKARLGFGDFFGELSLFTTQPANATCVAATTSNLLEVRHHYFQEIMMSYPRIGVNLCSYFATKLREAQY